MFVTEMTLEECRKALVTTSFGRLACAREDQPYVVPIFYAVDGDYAYSFSIVGQKIDWMRRNSRVCLEIDSVKSWNEWTSVVAFGRYEELPDTPNWQSERRLTRDLLRHRTKWWQPNSASTVEHEREASSPILFRIILESLTGHHGWSTPAARAAVFA